MNVNGFEIEPGANLIGANTGEQLLTTTIRTVVPTKLGEVYESGSMVTFGPVTAEVFLSI